MDEFCRVGGHAGAITTSAAASTIIKGRRRQHPLGKALGSRAKVERVQDIAIDGGCYLVYAGF
jgi:hypothetical protein